MKVSEVMTRGAAVVTPESTLIESARLMRDHGVGALPVVEDGMTLVGMITDRDIVVRALAENELGLSVRAVMSAVVYCVTPDADVEAAAEMMDRERIRRLPVVRNGELLGIVSLGDLAPYFRRDEQAADELSDISEPGTSRTLH